MGSIYKVFTLLLIAAIAISSLLFIKPATAEVENVSTSCSIMVDSIVEGQPVTALIQIYPAPSSGEIFNNLGVWITSPMQGVWGNGGNGPWNKGHISTDTDGKATVTFDIITFSGYWNIGLYFEGQYFANNTIYYQPGNLQTGFTVSPAKTPTPSPTAIPASAPAPTPIPSTTPIPSLSIPEFSWVMILPLFIFMLSIAVMVRLRKRAMNSNFNV
jgi:hypothetical protein